MAPRRTRKNVAGFTMIEIIIVIALVLGLSSFVGLNVINKFKQAKIDSAKIQMAAFQQSLQAYYLDNDMYPDTSQGLTSLVRKPTVGKEPRNFSEGGYFNKKELPKDPWGQDYRFESDYKVYTIISNGPDQEPNTEDDIKSE